MFPLFSFIFFLLPLPPALSVQSYFSFVMVHVTIIDALLLMDLYTSVGLYGTSDIKYKTHEPASACM